MKQVRLLMGMPIIVEIRDTPVNPQIFTAVFNYFRYVDRKFSPFKPDSEVSLINSKDISFTKSSPEMQKIAKMCDETSKLTSGYFNVYKDGRFNPSGLVKGWSIHQAASLIARAGYHDYYVDAGGDIQVKGVGWKVGIRNPFNQHENVKALSLSHNEGIATSGTYERGQHIYDPHSPGKILTDVVSLTVIGPNVYEADRFATAAFAMQQDGINFIESLSGFEGYMIDRQGMGTSTSGLGQYEIH